MDRLYYVEINWWSEYADNEEEIARFYAFASSLDDLAARINRNFSYINSINIKVVNSCCGDGNFFWVDDLTPDERKRFEECNDY